MLHNDHSLAKTQNGQKSLKRINAEMAALHEAANTIEQQAQTLREIFNDGAPVELACGLLAWINVRADIVGNEICQTI